MIRNTPILINPVYNAAGEILEIDLETRNITQGQAEEIIINMGEYLKKEREASGAKRIPGKVSFIQKIFSFSINFFLTF